MIVCKNTDKIPYDSERATPLAMMERFSEAANLWSGNLSNGVRLPPLLSRSFEQVNP
jgi:hypothetical protein